MKLNKCMHLIISGALVAQFAAFSQAMGASFKEIEPPATPITEADRAMAFHERNSRFSVKNAFKHPAAIFKKLTKEQKVASVHAASLALVAIIGLTSWDYGSSLFHSRNEGFFGEDTRYGGADKLGHYWSTYALAEAFEELFEGWGYDSSQAATLSSVSSWVVMGLMEVGDSFSKDHGFSYEDLTMNSLGAVTTYFFQKYPGLDEKIDMRVQYDFNVRPQDLFTDYENLKYILAIKAEGFRRFRNGPAQYLEFHLGYFTRDYRTENFDEKSRNLYAGIYVNFSRILKNKGRERIGRTLEFIQPSYTSRPMFKKDLND